MFRSICLLSAALCWPTVSYSVEFESDVASIFVRRCIECHKGKEAASGLDFTTRESAMRGGESGVVIHAAKPADSLLLERVAAGELPP